MRRASPARGMSKGDAASTLGHVGTRQVALQPHIVLIPAVIDDDWFDLKRLSQPFLGPNRCE
jgi:hypothetical protein